MPLFGLLSTLPPIARLQFEQLTAGYIENFYGNRTDGEGFSRLISDVFAEAIVTDQGIAVQTSVRSSPPKVIESNLQPSRNENHGFFLAAARRFGIHHTSSHTSRRLQTENCEGDPLTVILSVDLSYSTTNTSLAVEDIIQYPFSTPEFRSAYLDVLKSTGNDAFDDLGCVGEMTIPDDLDSSASRTFHKQPTNEPSEMKLVEKAEDDIFSDTTRSSSFYDRRCSLQSTGGSRDGEEETALYFVYGTETKDSDVYFVEDFEDAIIEYISNFALSCLNNHDYHSHLRRREENEEFSGVTRIRFPTYDEVTDIVKCVPTFYGAQGCAVLSTKLLVTTKNTAVSDVHNDILTVLMEAMNNDTFVSLLPELMFTSYLGPDIVREVSIAKTVSAEEEIESSPSNTHGVVLVAISAFLILITGFMVLCIAIPVRCQGLDRVIRLRRAAWHTCLRCVGKGHPNDTLYHNERGNDDTQLLFH